MVRGRAAGRRHPWSGGLEHLIELGSVVEQVAANRLAAVAQAAQLPVSVLIPGEGMVDGAIVADLGVPISAIEAALTPYRTR